jgi:hypothetical protein
MKRTYASMARDLGLTYCHGITATGHYCPESHDLNGSVTEGSIHFSDRPVGKVNNAAFLKLAAVALDPSINEESVPWRRVYRRALGMRTAGKVAHVRIPARHMAMDRAVVRAGVAGLTTASDPLRKRAFDWARRGRNV